MNLIAPHTIISQPVPDDLDSLNKVIRVAKEMTEICNRTVSTGYALAHCQVEAENPLRFFVFNMGSIMINPRIVNHTKTTVDSEEGCLSFLGKARVTVQRWNKIQVSCTLVDPEMFDGQPIHYDNLDLSGLEARIVQHEIDHFDGITIFDQERK